MFVVDLGFWLGYLFISFLGYCEFCASALTLLVWSYYL